MDWDEDGRKDLIVGERDGYVRIYLNTNTDADPAFSGYTYLQVNGVTYDIGYTASQYIIDWDNDGKKDVLIGEDAGYVYLLLNTGTNSAPAFTAAVRIQNGSGDLKVSSRASPVACDWNHDGAKDLLVGDDQGKFSFFDNKGTDAAPVFDGYKKLGNGEVDFDVGYYSRFDVVDWDNDGVEDIISGQYNNSGSPQGGVLFFRAIFMPAPDAKVNGLDGPVSVPQADNLTFTIGLDPGGLDGADADWWITIYKGYFQQWWLQYNGGNKKWTKSVTPIRFAGAGLRYVNSYKVLGPRTIPAGTYTFTFAVDDNKDDIYDGTFSDSVEITVY